MKIRIRLCFDRQTNSTRVIPIEDYKWWVSHQLVKAAELALRPKVITLFEEANGVRSFLRQSLATCVIPSTKLIIKYHKTIKEKGGFPTRLVIAAMNFSVTFSKLRYLGIKKIVYKVKVNYSRVSIVQSPEPKERLEELEVNRDGVKISSVDAINMYSSIKLATIIKALIFFTRKVTAATKKTIELCLDLIRFGICTTLISFNRYYY